MRICVFSPDVEPLAGIEWRARLETDVGPGHDVVLLTNSWADPPAGLDVYVTAGAEGRKMRTSRKVLSRVCGPAPGSWRGAIAEPFVKAVKDALLEGIRATDPDLIVSLHAGWAEQIRRRIRARDHAWPCIALGDPIPVVDTTWRRYDPTVKVSVVLPTYNGVRYLTQSIESCLSQTHANLELIVVDDGSGPKVGAIVDGFDDPRLLYIRHAANRGLPHALNTGFRRATGQFCSWTSDDNYYAPDALERMLAFLQTYTESDFVYAESYRSDESADAGVSRKSIIRTRPPESLAVDNFIGACFLYKRVVYERLGDFNPQAVLAEDYDYWVRVHQQFAMQRLFVPLYTYRFHSESLTSTRSPEEVARQVSIVKQAHRIGQRA